MFRGRGLEEDGHAPFLGKPGAPAQASLLKRAGENEGTNPQDGAEEEPPPPGVGEAEKKTVASHKGLSKFLAIDKECFWVHPRILIPKWSLVHPEDAARKGCGVESIH